MIFLRTFHSLKILFSFYIRFFFYFSFICYFYFQIIIYIFFSHIVEHTSSSLDHSHSFLFNMILLIHRDEKLYKISVLLFFCLLIYSCFLFSLSFAISQFYFIFSFLFLMMKKSTFIYFYLFSLFQKKYNSSNTFHLHII